MNYTYILKCADGTLYTGWTNDIEKRLAAHNSGRGAKYTKSRLPVSLFYLEEHSDRKTAMRREVQIKKMTRSEKMTLAETKKRILLVNACVRPESRTMELAREVLKHLDGVVEEVNIELEAAEKDPDSILNTLRKVIAIRHANPDLQSDGDFEVIYAVKDKYPFIFKRGQFIIAVNPTGKEQSAPFAFECETEFLIGSYEKKGSYLVMQPQTIALMRIV